MSAERHYVLGVDLGGTKTSAALVDREGLWHNASAVRTPALDGPEAILDAVCALAHEVLRGHDIPLSFDSLAAIGLGTAGTVDATAGTVIYSTDALTGWAGTDVIRGLSRRIAESAGVSLPIAIDNDVNAHAVGEAWRGASSQFDTSFMVAAGTGIGASIVNKAFPVRGAHGLAGGLGHLPVPGADKLRCSCGRLGHLEGISSGPAIHRRYLEHGGSSSCRDAVDVARRAAHGDGLAARLIQDSGRALGQAVAGSVMLLDPAVVVVGGGLAGAGSVWWDALEEELRRQLTKPFREVPLVRAALGQMSAIVGAARLAWREASR